jgi:hypothetical protein
MELETFAALLRVKLSREGKVDDFRVELFSRGDSLLSVYIRGFLGKSVLKTVLVHDSLTVYFPSDKLSYIGRREDLEVGELEKAGHIINFLLALFHGTLAVPDTSGWQYYSEQRGNRLRVIATDREYLSSLNTELSYSREDFPYIELQSLYLTSKDEWLKLFIEASSVHFNVDIPFSKFEIEIPPEAETVTKEELAELLTGIS